MTARLIRKGQWFGQDRSAGQIVATSTVALTYSLTLLFAQNPPASSTNLERGQKVYAERCVGCHGADFRGTDQGPALTGDPRVRRMSIERLQSIISRGIPNTGMAAFDLPAPDVDALALLVHSLNSRAVDSNLPGNPAAGEQFFFGKGKCGSCHMVSGKGQPIGPDLSSLGDERTV
ncbi:MAG TPA: c-type cytochrome, partial [Terriglobia bacterium]|nr:c-type cytochrome [Terriglobia bacterium]